MATFLGSVKLGALYKDNVAQPRATRPYCTTSNVDQCGNIAQFSNIPDMSKWRVGDTPSTETQQLQWHKMRDDNGNTLYICDRCILEGVSWDTLNASGYVNGKEITIDGSPYICRLLKGGGNYASSGDKNKAYLGGEKPNEWDTYVTNVDNIEGLPVPTRDDLAGDIYARPDPWSNLNGVHNQFWNWVCTMNWCQETLIYTSYKVIRGDDTARYFSADTSTQSASGRCWRPVLEQLNSPPVITGMDSNLGGKSEPFTVEYTVSDANNDVVIVEEYLDTTLIRSYAPVLGASNSLSVTSSVWYSLGLGNHTLKIVASDGKANAVNRVYSFNKVETLIKVSSRPVETSAPAKQVTISGIYTVPPGAVFEVYASNNAFDPTPTWESITTSAMSKESHKFVNTTKAGYRWGVSVMIQLLKGTATSEINCKGFGFTFE